MTNKDRDKSNQEESDNLIFSVVGIEEFRSVDIELPIIRSKKVDCYSLADLYRRAMSVAEGDSVRVYQLLSTILQIHFKPEDHAEPYGPFFVAGDRRGMVPADFYGEQSVVFGAVAANCKNPGLRARIADIA